MLTGAPPSDRASLTPASRRRVWPWAAGSILITLAVIAATLIGHRLAAQERLALQVAPAPAAPPLAIEAIARAPGQIAQLTLDTHTHTLVAQVAVCPTTPSTTPRVPQATGCDVSDLHPVSGVAFFDSATGKLRSQYLALSSSPTQAIALTDSIHGVTYLLCNGGVTTYDDATGKQTNRYESGLVANAQSFAFDEQLGLIYTLDDRGNLSAITAADGLVAASATLPPPSGAGFTAPQLIRDTSAGRVYIFSSGMNSDLLAYRASDLSSPLAWGIPDRAGLVLLDPANQTLYLTESPQGIVQLDLATLPVDGADATVFRGPGVTVNPVQPAQDNWMLPSASRFGIDSVTSTLVVINDTGAQAFASGETQPYAQLPLIHAPTLLADDPGRLLPIDPSAGRAYLPGADNTILIVSLARPTSYAAPNAATAALIARAGMAKLLPDTNQDPPFITAQTFPLDARTVTRHYFIHYSDLGWKGPYAGTASIGGVTAGATPGDYTMTFTITWNQLFLRQHSWTVEVTPDGRTHLRADSGDAIP